MPGPLDDVVLGAYERAKARAAERGEPEPSLGSFVDEQARAFEARGDTAKGRRLRDYLGQRQAADLPATATAAAQAHEDAVVQGVRKRSLFGVPGLFGKGTPTSTESAELEQARYEKAEAAGQPVRAPVSPDAVLPYSGVDPARQVDLLEAAGVPTKGLLEADVRRKFAEHFGDQVPTDEAAAAVGEHLWRTRASNVQAEEAEGAEKRGEPIQPIDFGQGNVDLARTYVRDVEAQRVARASERAADKPLLTAFREGLGAVMESGAALGSTLRQEPVSGTDVATALTGGDLQDTEARAVIQHALDTPSLNLLRGGLRMAADAVPIGALARGIGAGLQAARMSAEAARILSTPLALGFWSGATSNGPLDERLKASVEGATLGLVAGTVSPLVHRVVTKLPSRAANAVSEALGFLAGDVVVKGGDISGPEAFNALVLGTFLGAQHAKTPAEARLLAARAVVRDAFERAGAIRVTPDGKAVINPDFIQTPDEAARAPANAAQARALAANGGVRPTGEDLRPRRVLGRQPLALPPGEPPTIVGPRNPPPEVPPAPPSPAGQRYAVPRAERVKARGVSDEALDAWTERAVKSGVGKQADLRLVLRQKFGIDAERAQAAVARLWAAQRIPAEVAEAHGVQVSGQRPEGPREQYRPEPTGYGEPYRVPQGVTAYQRLVRRFRREQERSMGAASPRRIEEHLRNLDRLRGTLKAAWEGLPEKAREQALRQHRTGLEYEGGKPPEERGGKPPPEAPAGPPAAPPPEGGAPAAPAPEAPQGPPAAPAAPPPKRRRIMRAPQHEKAVEKVAAQRKELRRLEDERYRDTKTGTRNADAWEAAKAREVGPGRKVARFDLGEFKGLNDEAGHEAGDRALGKVGALLREAAAEVGLPERNLFRTGGDEFTASGPAEVIDRFHEAVRRRGAVEEAGRKVHLDGGVGDTAEAADVAARSAKAKRKGEQGIGPREEPAKPRRVLRTGKTKAEPASPPKAPPPKPREPEKGGADAVPQREAETVPVGKAPGDRPPLDGGAREPSGPKPGEAKPGGKPPARPAIPEARQVKGKETTIPTRGGRVKARYAVVEADDLLPSHGPDFAWSKGYPRDLQERDYATDKGEQAKVHAIRGKFDPAEVVSTAPRATEGPPSVTPDGTVVNGNGRAMGLVGLDAKAREKYLAHLREHAADFGLDAEAIGKMKKPVLVRVVDMDPGSREAVEFGRLGNEGGTRAVSPMVAAQRHVSLVGDSVWDSLRTSPDATVSETINDPGAAGTEFRKRLRDAIPDEERPRYFHEDGTLTGAGKELAEDMILLRSLADARDAAGARRAGEVLDRLPGSLRRTLSQSAVQLLDLRRKETGRRQVEGLVEAADYLSTVMGGESPAEWFRAAEQGGIEPPPLSPEGRGWIDWLHANRSSPKKVREVLKALAELEDVSAREERGLFRGATPESRAVDRLAQVLDGWRPKNGEAVVVADRGGLLFSPDVEGQPLASSARANEWPASMAGTPPPDPIAEAPSRRTGFALDLPPMTHGPTAEWKGRRVSAHRLIRALQRAIEGIPIRVGRMTPAERKRAAGYLKVGPEVVRLREANDVPTAAHEAAHAVEKIVFWNQRGKPNALPSMGGRVGTELERLGRMLYGPTVPNAGYVREGFAEFVRGWMFGTPDVAKHAPAVKAWFEGQFAEENPRIFKRLKAAKDLAAQFVAQGRENLYRASIGRAPREVRGALRRTLKAANTKMMEAGDAVAELADAAATRRGTPLALREDPYALLTGLRLTHTARARYMVDTAMIDVAKNNKGPSLKEATAIVAEYGKRRGWSRRETKDRFILYLWGRRAIERIQRRHANPGMSLADAQALVREFYSPEFSLAAEKVYRWNRGLIEYAVSGGALSRQEANAILAGSTDYIPLQRAVDSMDPVAAARAVRGGTPLRKFRGSGEAIRDPFEVMRENAEKMVRWTHERMVADAIVGLSRVEGMGRYVEKIPREVVAQSVELDAIRKQLEQAGADLTGADPDAVVSFFSPAPRPPNGKPIIAHRDARTGKVSWYEVDPRVYEAIHGLDVERLPKWIDATFGKAKRLLTLGTTGLRAPFALVTNPFRDSFIGYLQSATRDDPVKYFGEQVRSMAQGAARIFGREDPYYDLFRGLGGEMANILGVDTRQGRRASRELFSGKGWKGRTVRVLTTPIEHLRDFLQFPESATRVAELRRVAARVGWKPGDPITLDQSLAMLIAAKRVTVDFTAAGTWARSANQVIPFFNASLQGARSFARSLRDRPLATVLKAITTRLIPTLLLWNAHKDEDWYKDMPWREKFSHWWIPVGDDELLAIPRVYDWDNAFSVLPEAVLDSLYRKDPEAAAQAIGNLFETSPLQYLPWSPTDGFRFGILGENPIAGELLEQGFNRDTFTQQRIVPEGQKELPVREQVAPYTSGIARFVGDTLGWSPRRIDHALRGFTGGLAHDTADVVDALGRVFTGKDPGIGFRGPSRGEFKDVPIVGAALGRRGGREGVGSLAVDRLYDALGAAREREASKDNPETPQERQRRLTLEDAGKAVKWLRVLQGAGSTQAERQAIQREIRSIAQRALAEAGRRRFAGEAKRAESRARAATTTPAKPRRILGPGR